MERCKKDIMGERIEHLDALLFLVTNDLDGGEGHGFQNLNKAIQTSVLLLASSLATEIRELNEALEVESARSCGR
jgi:hypothetical protein